jgi:hypothetical protein
MPPPSRRPGYVRPSRGGRTGLSRITALRAVDPGGDLDLRAAAEIVADGAKTLAGTWSAKIPPSIYVTVDGNVATVHAAAPDARPAEFRLMHPLFGDREHWYGPPGERFLAPALDAKADAALQRYMRSVDAYAKKIGWAG